MANERRILFIPHVHPGGGAGIYLSRLANSLSVNARVDFGGRFAQRYAHQSLANRTMPELPLFFVPNYQGVATYAKFYWAARSVLEAVMVGVRWKKWEHCFLSYDVVVLTSSVQIPILTLTKHARFPTVFVLVQENLELDGIFGELLFKLLRRAGRVISITRDWQVRAARKGLSADYLPNPFSAPSEPGSRPKHELFDAIYAGGDSRLKGFEEILNLFEALAGRRKIRIIMCGSYGRSAMARIAAANAAFRCNGSLLDVRGVVDNIENHLNEACLVLLPIREAHFCRLAVEAGFHGKTFVVTDLRGIQDFAVPDVNCLSFRKMNIADFAASVQLLLDDPVRREQLERSNQDRSSYMYDAKNWGDSARELFNLGGLAQ